MINIIYAALLLIGAFLVARFCSRNEIITKHNKMLGYFAAGLMVIAAVLYIRKTFKSEQCNSSYEVSEDKRPVICTGCDSCFSTLDSLYRHYDEYYCPRSSVIRHFFKLKYHKEAYPDQIKCYRVAFHRLVEIDVKAYNEKSAIKQARSFVDLESYKQCEDVYIGTNDIDSTDYGKYTIDGHPYSDSRIRNIVTKP